MDNNIIHENNENLRKKLFFISANVYNFTIGFFSFLIFLGISWSMMNYKNYIEIAIILIFIVLLVPLNIYLKKKSKMNIILYLILNALSYILGYGLYIFIT
mgnify:CR=1 FL=1